MSTVLKLRAAATVVCVLALVARDACARDTGHLLRVADVVAEMRADGAVADVAFAFGADARVQGTVVRVEGSARPYGAHGEPLPDDEQTCRKALRDALGQLAQAARRAGKPVVAGIVSDAFGRAFDGGRQVECHSGVTHSAVALKGTLADTAPDAPDAPAMPVAAFADLPFDNPTPAAHGRVVPQATSFAQASNIDAVPVQAAQRDRYREYLVLRTPKAFAIDELGNTRQVGHARDAMVRVLESCTREHVRCWLYAVDERVVWSDDVEQRVGLAQLQDDGLLGPSMIPVATPPKAGP